MYLSEASWPFHERPSPHKFRSCVLDAPLVSSASAPLTPVRLHFCPCGNNRKMTQVTGTGGEEGPTPTPAPVDAPEQTPAPTPAPAAGVGGLVGAIKNAVTGHGDSSSGETAAAAQPPADGASGMLGNLTSSISSAAHTVTETASSTIHSVTDAASGLVGGKKDDDAAPAAGDVPAADKEGMYYGYHLSMHALGVYVRASTCCFYIARAGTGQAGPGDLYFFPLYLYFFPLYQYNISCVSTSLKTRLPIDTESS